jgi:hypothetical protein
MVFPFVRHVSERAHGHPDGFRVKARSPCDSGWIAMKRAPINNRSLYKIEHSKLILSASRPAAEATRPEHRPFLHGIFACP